MSERILICGNEALAEAAIIAERIQQAIQTPTRINGRKIVVTASIGVILSDLRYTIPEDILRDADIAMYHAKMRGKACYAVFQPSMHKHSIMRMELENELREILSSIDLSNEHLFVVYQPIIRGQVLPERVPNKFRFSIANKKF